MLRLGRITGAHGLRGGMRYRPDNPDSATLAKGSRVVLEVGGNHQEHTIRSIAPGGRGMLRRR